MDSARKESSTPPSSAEPRQQQQSSTSSPSPASAYLTDRQRRRARPAAEGGGTTKSSTTAFHIPSGKKIIVALPEDAARLRDKYYRHRDSKHDGHACTPRGHRPFSSSSGPVLDNVYGNDARATTTTDEVGEEARGGEEQEQDGDEVQIEVVIHGSAEHSGHLHSARKHHESRREALARRFGADFDEWESLRDALDEVYRQLDGLVQHEAPSTLSANFERFGYSATLKTYGGHGGGHGGGHNSSTSSTPGSARASISGNESDGSSTLRSWEDNSGATITRLFQRPVIKQYHHKGLIWRNSEQTEIMSFELFFELIYVGIIHYNGEHVADKTDAMELGRFIITFVMSWQVWSDVQQGISWFEANDVVQRVYILFTIACLLGFTTNMTGTFNTEYDTYTQLAGYYIAARLATALFYGVTIYLLPLVKGFMLAQVVLIVIPSMIWIGSIFVDVPTRFALIVVALLIDYFGPSVAIYPWAFTRPSEKPRSRRFAKFFEFWPAINIEHRVERTDAFVALVIGWAVVALLYQNAGAGLNAILGKAVIGLVQAFVFNWLYFDIDGCNIHLHAIRRAAWSSAAWSMAHLPFICAYTLSSAAMSKIVVAHDSPNSDPLSLESYYADKSKPYVTQGVRWAYCAGLGVALFHMGIISMTHVHKVPRGLRVHKNYRMLNRAAVCLVFFCLPLAGDRLDSLSLVSITMALMVWVLLLEAWGKSCAGQTWCGKGLGEGRCRGKYQATCSEKTLEKCLKQERASAGADFDREAGLQAADESGEVREKAANKAEVEVLQLSRKEKGSPPEVE